MALPTAFIFTLLVPGLIAHKFFRLQTHEKWAFIPLFSILVSTQLVYYLSMLAGYSKETILASFLALTAVYTLVTFKKGEPLPLKTLPKIKKTNKTVPLVLLVIFALSLAVLLRSVWYTNQYGIVITGSNWQDTPLHYEIIESLNNGNFPPQMPYFAGEPMSYHYFVDFHTAILEKTYGYLPTLLPFLNAVFIGVFALAIYGLARGSGRRAALIATVIAVFGAGFSYVGLFSAFANGTFSAGQNYIYQYDGLFGLPSMFDNLLQQRPLLIGLPAFALVLMLLRKMEDKNRIVLAGIITGLLFPFHVISFVCCYLAFFLSVFLNLKRFSLSYLYFLAPTALALPFILSGAATETQVAFGGAWAANFVKENPVFFYVLNLGVPFLVALVSLFKKGNNLLKVTFLALFLLPNLVLLTPNPWDMYKFFVFAWVPIAVLAGTMLAKTKKGLAVLLIALSVLSSASVVLYNVGTSYSGASWAEYNLGMWVRENTPENSVFLTYPAIHSPAIMIGGRLAVSSYINWPYGHGVPLTEIWGREANITLAYTGTEADLQAVVQTYHVNYVYVSSEELNNYPGCVSRFNQVSWLETVYLEDGLRIYQVEAPS